MTRIAIGAAFSLFVATTSVVSADTEPDSNVVAAASEAGVSPTDLLGALNTTHLDPVTYLCTADGVLCPPLAIAPAISACDWPICGALGARLFCIEGYESHHNGRAVNPSSGAAGWLQWLSGTARAWGVVIGDRWSEWQAAARMAAQGERFFRSQWPINAARC